MARTLSHASNLFKWTLLQQKNLNMANKAFSHAKCQLISLLAWSLPSKVNTVTVCFWSTRQIPVSKFTKDELERLVQF